MVDEVKLPDYLSSVLDDAEEAMEWRIDQHGKDPSQAISQVSDSIAREQRHLRSFRGDPTPLTALDELRTHSELDAEDLSVYRDGSLSYNNAEATIEAILVSSLQSFIYTHLNEWVDEQYDTAEETEVAA